MSLVRLLWFVKQIVIVSLIILNLFSCCCPHIIRQIVESTLQHVAVSLFVQVVVCLGGSIAVRAIRFWSERRLLGRSCQVTKGQFTQPVACCLVSYCRMYPGPGGAVRKRCEGVNGAYRVVLGACVLECLHCTVESQKIG